MRMKLRLAAMLLPTVLLAACQSAPSKSAWLMQDGTPWVGPDGQCLQLRPLAADEKQGFCYDVMTGAYQKKHHYEQLDTTEFGFLFPHVEPTPESAYAVTPPPSDLQVLTALQMHSTLPHSQQIYTALPFKFNNAHLSSRNRVALRDSFDVWHSQGIQIVSVTVTGHTDSTGPKDYNFLLSKWRAESVAYFLAHLGIPKGAITEGGVGMLDPHPNARRLADNRYVDLQVWLTTPADPTAKTAMLWRLGL
jgi:outer membrane protein OmpA-like peptidoglycan-associated protein